MLNIKSILTSKVAQFIGVFAFLSFLSLNSIFFVGFVLGTFIAAAYFDKDICNEFTHHLPTSIVVILVLSSLIMTAVGTYYTSYWFRVVDIFVNYALFAAVLWNICKSDSIFSWK